MIVTVDGPSGVGKSSLTNRVATELNFKVLYSGLIYRKFAQIVRNTVGDIRLLDNNLIRDLTDEHRVDLLMAARGEIDRSELAQFAELASIISAIPEVRRRLLPIQRDCYIGIDFIAEGRDMGSIVFPNADLKIFIDCTLTTKISRRLKSISCDTNQINLNLNQDQINIAMKFVSRDLRDLHREIAPTIKPEGAVFILNENSFEKLVKKVVRLIKLKKLD